MIVKFFKGGRTYSGAKSAFRYLLNERVQQGTARVYEGDPELTLAIIKNIPRKWKFTSGVIAFEEPYQQIKEQLPKIIKAFEETFFAGLAKDQYDITYILHTDKGKTELHFITPRTELTTGKDLAIYTNKKDLAKKDMFQRFINAAFNLSNPLDPDKMNIAKAPTIREKDNKKLKERLNEFFVRAIEQGKIKNRDEIVKALEDAGFEVVRKTKKSITILNPDTQKRVRLEGAIYAEDFTGVTKLGEELERRRQQIEANRRESKELGENPIKQFFEKLERDEESIRPDKQDKQDRTLGERLIERIRKDAERNGSKYKQTDRRDGREANERAREANKRTETAIRSDTTKQDKVNNEQRDKENIEQHRLRVGNDKRVEALDVGDSGFRSGSGANDSSGNNSDKNERIGSEDEHYTREVEAGNERARETLERARRSYKELAPNYRTAKQANRGDEEEARRGAEKKRRALQERAEQNAAELFRRNKEDRDEIYRRIKQQIERIIELEEQQRRAANERIREMVEREIGELRERAIQEHRKIAIEQAGKFRERVGYSFGKLLTDFKKGFERNAIEQGSRIGSKIGEFGAGVKKLFAELGAKIKHARGIGARIAGIARKIGQLGERIKENIVGNRGRIKEKVEEKRSWGRGGIRF